MLPGSSGVLPGPIEVKFNRTDPALHTAPVIHIDGAEQFLATGDLVKFNLTQDRVVGPYGTDPTVPLERIVCARLVMTPTVLKQLTDWLQKNANLLFAAEQG